MPTTRKVFEYSGVDEIEAHFARRHAPVTVSGAVRAADLDYRIEALGEADAGWSDLGSRSGFTLALKTDLDKLLIQMPLQQGLVDRSRYGDLEVRSGRISIVNSRHIRTISYQPDLRVVALTFGMERLTRVLANLTGGPAVTPLDFMSVVSSDDAVACTLVSLMQSLQLAYAARLPSSSLVLGSIEESIALLLLESLPHSHSARLRPGGYQVTPAVIRRAVEFMHANADRPIRLLEIAEHAGISIRSLQANFIRYKDATPMDYLRRLRLQGARDALCDPRAGSIAEVALRWGFASPGRFSVAFREAFGETPRNFIRRHRV